MISKSIDEGLLHRIQTFVANDINDRKILSDEGGILTVTPERVYILAFSRILSNWQAVASVADHSVGYYQLSHDGSINETLCTIYQAIHVAEAIV